MAKNKNDKKLTKELIDNILNLQRVFKAFIFKSWGRKRYTILILHLISTESLNGIVKLYNKVEFWEQKKLYSLEKFKLNFQNSTLLSGWDVK